MNLELLAMRWLRWEKRCVIVLMERSPRAEYCGQPDVLGVTKDRYLYEIEIKRTPSDFRADAKKPSRKLRNAPFAQAKFPKQFYYLVPPTVLKQINGELPDWAGLMCGPAEGEVQSVRVINPAPIWKPSSKLSPKECGHLVLEMANQILALAESYESIRNYAIKHDGSESWLKDFYPNCVNFQI